MVESSTSRILVCNVFGGVVPYLLGLSRSPAEMVNGRSVVSNQQTHLSWGLVRCSWPSTLAL